ncbi:MAG: hypothetical protein R3D61_05525 [Defluviimonas denitrificans]
MSVKNDTGSEDRDLTAEELAAIEEEYDEGARTRAVSTGFARFLKAVALAFATYHYLTAGFALPADYWHMGWHLSGLFILIYALFPMFRTHSAYEMKTGPLHLGGVPLLDVLLMALGVASALYLGFAWQGVPWLGIEEQTFRMGNPNIYDMIFGCILIVLVLDIARRTLGWVLPAIICVFMAYALFGPIFPGILQHPGVKFRTFVSSMCSARGDLRRHALGRLDHRLPLRAVRRDRAAHRAGPAFHRQCHDRPGAIPAGLPKVSVVSSAFFGTISALRGQYHANRRTDDRT